MATLAEPPGDIRLNPFPSGLLLNSHFCIMDYCAAQFLSSYNIMITKDPDYLTIAFRLRVNEHSVHIGQLIQRLTFGLKHVDKRKAPNRRS